MTANKKEKRAVRAKAEQQGMSYQAVVNAETPPRINQPNNMLFPREGAATFPSWLVGGSMIRWDGLVYWVENVSPRSRSITLINVETRQPTKMQDNIFAEGVLENLGERAQLRGSVEEGYFFDREFDTIQGLYMAFYELNQQEKGLQCISVDDDFSRRLGWTLFTTPESHGRLKNWGVSFFIGLWDLKQELIKNDFVVCPQLDFLRQHVQTKHDRAKLAGILLSSAREGKGIFADWNPKPVEKD